VGATTTVLSSGNALPIPVVLGAGGRAIPSETIEDDDFTSFDPTTDGADFFEAVESMLVRVNDAKVVNGTNRFGEIFVVADGGIDATGISARGTLNISPDDFNPEKIQVDENTNLSPALPDVDVGDSLSTVVGVVSYDFGNYQIFPTQPVTRTLDAGLEPESTKIVGAADTLTVATYNVLNLDPNDDDGDRDVALGRFDAIAAQIVDRLGSPDIIGVQEIQDNSGSTNDGVTAADVTLQALVDAIDRAGGPTYAFIDTPVVDGTVGGQPGGNIRVAFLYNPGRTKLVDGTARTVGIPGLPGDPFFGSRTSAAADFVFNGETVTVVNNHLSSKGGSAPIVGLEQPFEARQEEVIVNGSLDERQLQAGAVQDFVADILADDPDAKVIVLGDMNEFEFVSPVATILGRDLVNTTDSIGEDERYTFIFQGNSQSLDHILLSPALVGSETVDIVHVNVEFAEVAERASDHDPIVVGLQIRLPGDIDGDGKVSRRDLRALIRALIRGKFGKYDANADLDGDGDVDARDLLQLLKLLKSAR